MRHELRRYPDAREAAAAGATLLAELTREAVAESGSCTLALSGGTTPEAMFPVLAGLEVPWSVTSVFQVDERVAPDGDSARNATHLVAGLGAVLVEFAAMDVTAVDLEAAADAYASLLPGRLDVVHLGLGPDGHTASLVPGDRALEVTDRLVAVAGPYQGHLRLTLTYPAINAARTVVWLVAGADKHDALAKLLDGDASIPAGRVHAARSVVFADEAAT